MCDVKNNFKNKKNYFNILKKTLWKIIVTILVIREEHGWYWELLKI
jgi:hypothetical protein